MAAILLVEDDVDLRYSVRATLEREGHAVAEAGDVPEALRLYADGEYSLVLTDLRLPTDSGLALIRAVRDEDADVRILVMTSDDSVHTAIEAMKLGADEYLLKPLRVAELTLTVDRALRHRRRDAQLRLHRRLSHADDHDEPIGESAAWAGVLALARRLAEMPLPAPGKARRLGGNAQPTVLITGETGVGKGVVAREIHAAASDQEAPFVHVNCAALPPALIEAELFGHERGAFTDAKEAREGLFEMAEGGTIFLDEIGELPLDLQSKMLLVLEEGVVRRVGGTRTRSVCARVVAATNIDLPARVREGDFRSDLFYRLNTFTITIPPLREREDDAVGIARVALQRFARQFGREGMRLGEDAERAIRGHRWPGNVRELTNVIQHAAMLCDQPLVRASDLAITRIGSDERGSDGLRFDFDGGPHTAEDVERALVEQALQHTGGNVTAAARLIGMQRSSLRNRIDRYGLHELVKELTAS
ncbi:MAG: sigma-54 dependent transcriptional regulator [Planctomycetota bacterium]